MAGRRTPSPDEGVEQYSKATCQLHEDGITAIQARVAERMGVTRAAMSEYCRSRRSFATVHELTRTPPAPGGRAPARPGGVGAGRRHGLEARPGT